MKLSGKYQLRVFGAVMILLILLTPAAFGSQGVSRITDLQVRSATDEIVLGVEGAIEYGYFPLSEPNRLVFDFPGTVLSADGGTTIAREVTDAAFREIRLSQFSADPPIARLVVYLNSPASANVSFDPGAETLVIQIITSGSLSNLLDAGPASDQEVTITAGETPGPITSSHAPAECATAADPRSAYEISPSDSEVVIRFPGMIADDVSVRQLSFPDRLQIRILTAGPIGDIRPRFDSLARGNIWNDVAKQWSSYFDRDGLGVVDLTLYLYPDVGYTQSIGADGIPEVRILEVPPSQAAAEVVVASYPSQEAETVPEPEATAPDTSSIFIAPVVTAEEETEVYAEPERPVSTVAAVETTEVIPGAQLLSEAPESSEPRNLIAEATLASTREVPSVPMTLRQDNLLSATRGEGQEPLYMRVGDVVVIGVDELVRASIGNPQVATLNVISQSELLVTALSSGNTTLLTWEAGRDRVTSREINVLDATRAHEEEIGGVIGDDNISVRIIMSGGGEGTPGVVLEGAVQTEEERNRAERIAGLYAGDRVTNLIEVTDPRQVLVKVRVVEIDSRALDERLSQFAASARADNDSFTIGIITDLLDPENPGGGLLDTRVRPGIVNGNIEDVIFDPIDAALNELESNRQANILSEPNVVALSGHEAHFRVGGEVPYTYQNENGVTVVEFKEFGVSLDIVPNVDSRDNIMLLVKPVVRTVDMALAIAGIPGFRTREMNTVVQLRPGETLVIGGLIQNEVSEIVSKIPILSEIPILGELFQSRRFNEDETELVIFLTPYILEDAAMSHEIISIPDLETDE